MAAIALMPPKSRRTAIHQIRPFPLHRSMQCARPPPSRYRAEKQSEHERPYHSAGLFAGSANQRRACQLQPLERSECFNLGMIHHGQPDIFLRRIKAPSTREFWLFALFCDQMLGLGHALSYKNVTLGNSYRISIGTNGRFSHPTAQKPSGRIPPPIAVQRSPARSSCRNPTGSYREEERSGGKRPKGGP